MSNTFDLDAAGVQEIADLADVDVRTVVRRIAGLPVRGRTGLRIDRAMAALSVRPKEMVMGGRDVNSSYSRHQARQNLNELGIQTDDDYTIPLVDNLVASGESGTRAMFRNLESELVRQIEGAEFIVGCVAWLTSEPILKAMATVRGASIVVQKEDFLRPDAGSPPKDRWKSDLKRLYGAVPGMSRSRVPMIGGLSVACDPDMAAIRCAGIMGDKRNATHPRCHNKFLVFCTEGDAANDCSLGQLQPYAVWTGSFNFTRNATFSFENAVIMTDQAIVEAYYAEYQQIAALSEPLDWFSDYVQPEWRVGT